MNKMWNVMRIVKKKKAFDVYKNSFIRKPTTSKAASDNQNPVTSLTQDSQTQS